jgi:hypothetical protein
LQGKLASNSDSGLLINLEPLAPGLYSCPRAHIADTARALGTVEQVSAPDPMTSVKEYTIRTADGQVVKIRERLLPAEFPLTENSIVVDENVVIALKKRAAGVALQPGEEAALKRYDSLAQKDQRLPAVVGERHGDSHGAGFPMTHSRESPEYQAVLSELKTRDVGQAKGLEDRLIIADVIFSTTTPGAMPSFATHDPGVYGPLLRMKGTNPKSLGKPIAEYYPNGFEVLVLGKYELMVYPLPKK